MTRKLVKEFLTNESGATAIEYSLIAVGITVAIITAVSTLGTNVQALFVSVTGGFN